MPSDLGWIAPPVRPDLIYDRHTSQLPDNVTDSLVILDLLRELVVTFLHVDMPEPEKAPVVMLVRDRPDLSA